jgi:hypothetical protein
VSWFGQAGVIAREIVAKRVTLLAAIPTLYALGTSLGVDWPWESDQIVAAVGAGLTILSAAVAIFWTRKDVTPADVALQPRDKQGRALTVATAPARPHP